MTALHQTGYGCVCLNIKRELVQMRPVYLQRKVARSDYRDGLTSISYGVLSSSARENVATDEG